MQFLILNYKFGYINESVRCMCSKISNNRMEALQTALIDRAKNKCTMTFN